MLRAPPFPRAQQLCADFDPEATIPSDESKSPIRTLPGQPCVPLNNLAGLEEFLYSEFCAPDLEAIAPHLWVMSTQSSANINPLHRQRVKGREILVTEDPRLHLVWIHDRIFIKPLPSYLLSYEFWKAFLLPKPTSPGSRQELIEKAVTGYLRTYRYLIQHESDFIIAKQDHLRLIPQHVQWPEFCYFISNFGRIEDIDVSGRYCYGELRLSRLNFYAPFFFRRFNFEQLHGQYSDYFARLYGPVLFVFAMASTLLNAMQVGIAVEQVSAMNQVIIWSICGWVSGLITIGTALMALCFGSLWLWMFLDEWVYAVRCRLSKKQDGALRGQQC